MAAGSSMPSDEDFREAGRAGPASELCSGRAKKYRSTSSASLAKHSPPMLLAHFVGNADPRQPHELGERSIRSA
jgi:hypothetical protein